MILIAQQMHQLKTLLGETTMSTRRQKYYSIPQEGISGHKHDKKKFNPMSYIQEKSAGSFWMKKKNWKISLKSLRKRLQNLIKKSHKTLLVFSVKVKCHLQKVLSFTVSKEICNWISFFFCDKDKCFQSFWNYEKYMNLLFG